MGTIDIMLKDLQTVLEFAKQTGSTMPLTALTAQLHHLLSAQGHGGEDNAALIRLYDTGSD